MIIAHRGASAEAPENTLASFKLAWKKGADGIEGDFYLTRDGQIVTIHDATTKRTANKNLVVAQSTLAELRKLDFGSWKSSQYAAERIPTLSEVLATVPPGKKIFIEIKCGPEIAPELKKVLRASRLKPAQTIVIAFDEKVIAAVKKQIPTIKAYWLAGYRRDRETGKWYPTITTLMKTLKAIDADGLDTQNNTEVVNGDFVRALRAAGMEFHVWTVDKPSEARYFQRLGVDSITTNHAKHIRQSLATPNLGKHLQLHLKMDGDLFDSSGHNRHGLLKPGPQGTPSFVPDVFGKAIHLDRTRASIAMRYFAKPWYNYQTILDDSIDPNLLEMWIYQDGLLRFRATDNARSSATRSTEPAM